MPELEPPKNETHWVAKKPVLCDNCGKHKGTIVWTGSEGPMALTHGNFPIWCKCCCVKAQIEYAKKLAARIPKLERELTKGNCDDMEAF
jgi:hypothetical protein